MEILPNVKTIRRNNLRLLAQRFGSMAKLGKHINRSSSQMSHLIGINGRKNIGNKLAFEIEKALGLPPGWLDEPHPDEESSYLDASYYTISNAPLLNDQEILLWIQKPMRSMLKTNTVYIRTHLKLHACAFAYQVQNDLMEAPYGISIPQGCIVIADPELPLRNNAYIILQVDNADVLQIRQLVMEGSRKYLKPQNPCYPITELTTSNYIICGILRQITTLL